MKYSYIIILLTVLIASPANGKDRKKKNKAAVEMQLNTNGPDFMPIQAIADKPLPNLRKPRMLMSGGGAMLCGIDVSHYQGTINWKEVAHDSNAAFAYIKASEGGDLADDCYERNIREARKYGIKAGSYHFFRPNTPAKQQFELFKKLVDPRKQDLVPLVDVEVIGGVSILTMHVRLQELLSLLTDQYNGRTPVIYTGRNFYNKYFAGYQAFRKYKFMIAAYQDNEPELDAGDDYIIWQFTAKGHIDGIRGNVDRSRFVGTHGLNEILMR